MDIGSVPGEIGILPGYREVTGTPREPYGPSWALAEERRGGQRWAARPSPPSPNRTRRRGRRPAFLLSLLFPPSRILFQLGKGGVLLPEGVGLLLARHTLAGRPPSLEPLYMEAGAPLDTQVDPRDHILSRVRCPLPP